MVKSLAITLTYAAIYSRTHRSDSNQNPRFYDNFSGFKGNYPFVIIYKIYIWK